MDDFFWQIFLYMEDFKLVHEKKMGISCFGTRFEVTTQNALAFSLSVHLALLLIFARNESLF